MLVFLVHNLKVLVEGKIVLGQLIRIIWFIKTALL